jgi:phage terminase small subunit
MTREDQKDYLTRVQKNFVKEYPIDFNGTEAYMRASGTKNRKSASAQASYLLKIPKVREAIDIYVQQTLGPKEKHLLENVDFWISVRDAPDARYSDRLKASEMLAKYQQMFVERREYDISGQVQIVDDIK